jgi:hypothetical protein
VLEFQKRLSKQREEKKAELAPIQEEVQKESTVVVKPLPLK